MFKNCFSPDMLATREIHLMAALSACAGAYYDFNVTKNVIIGTPVQIIDGVAYSIHKTVGLPDQCPYTQVIEFWGSKLAEPDRKAFFDFFSRDHLVACYHRGERNIAHTYWTKDVLGNPMLAEQTIVLYEEVTTGDLLGLTYVKDLTNFFRVEEAGKQALAAKEELEALNQALTEAKYATEQAYIAAEHANNAKTTFLGNMSHDIRTPMNAIIGFTSLAAKHLDNKELLKDYLGKIMVSSEHLLALINDVLDMSRIESGKFKMEENLQNVGEDKAPEEEQEVINRDAFRGMHVLLADDVPLNRELAVVMLEEAGFEVDTAENGKEVVERLQTAKSGYYDLVLMDVMMPVMDGYEATRQIRRLKDPALSGVPIIAMTANAFEEDRRAALDAGMNDHLAKPFRLEKLYQILKEHLATKIKE